MTLFWMVAAALVMASRATLDRLSPVAGAAATIAVIVAAAYAYTRLTAPKGGVTHALSVGITWLVLSIVTELTIAARLGHGWFTLIGSPDHPLLRNVYLFVWIFAPALFAKGEDSNSGSV
jgi:hypothetical protein